MSPSSQKDIANEASDTALCGLSDDVIHDIIGALKEENRKDIKEKCDSLSAVDIAELIEKIPADLRNLLISVLGKRINPEVFTHVDHDLSTMILQHMNPSGVATILNALESDDALDLITDFDTNFQKDTLRCLSTKMRVAVEEGLTFPEDSAGRLMQRELVAVPEFWTVGKTVDYLRAANHALPTDFYDLFIVDPMHHVVGKVPISQILKSKRSVKINNLIKEDTDHTISADVDQEEVAHLFRRYRLVSAPVVNENNRLIGVITVDDIVEVLDEEAEEDFLKLGGVAHDDIYSAAITTAKSRFSWLAVNLMTAIAASLVIGIFEGTIKELVALAVLMPIVASMGGNAGTQTLTVTIRALATRELSSANARRVIGKEFIVGVINGILFALLIGCLVSWWFSNSLLGGVIGMAMVINLIVAGLSGITIPLILNKFDLDPAISSAIILTTVTDMLGFFAFLGLAWWILL